LGTLAAWGLRDWGGWDVGGGLLIGGVLLKSEGHRPAAGKGKQKRVREKFLWGKTVWVRGTI